MLNIFFGPSISSITSDYSQCPILTALVSSIMFSPNIIFFVFKHSNKMFGSIVPTYGGRGRGVEKRGGWKKFILMVQKKRLESVLAENQAELRLCYLLHQSLLLLSNLVN